MRRCLSGFTLIELIVVIVILGILAVTVAPKFIDLQSDARIATLNGVKAAMQSTATMVFGKSILKSQEKSNSTKLSLSSIGDIAIKYGYPIASENGIIASLDISAVKTTDGSKVCQPIADEEWCYYIEKESTATTQGEIHVFPVGMNYDSCGIVYSDSTKFGEMPKIEMVQVGC